MIKTFSLIEAPIYQGQKHFGVSLGPAFLRQVLLDQNYYFNSVQLQYSQSWSNVNLDAYENLSYLVERELRRNQFPFIVGGDHSLSIGTIQGLMRYRPNTKIIWIDAHADINTRASSITKSFHGMPLSFLLHEDLLLKKTDWFIERLDPKNLLYVGLRDLDPEEITILKKYDIKHFTANEFHQGDLKRIFEEVKSFCQDSEVHISLDADAFDPNIAVSTGVPVYGGLTFAQVDALIECVQIVADIIGFEFVELNPQIFKNVEDVFQTASLGIKIFNKIITNINQKRSYYGITDRNHKEAKSILDYRSI